MSDAAHARDTRVGNGSAQRLPYGAWSSPITSASVVAGTIGLKEIRLDSGQVYWIERRPQERREVVVRARAGAEPDDTLLPKDFNVRTMVHSYGGGAYTVGAGVIYASRFEDQRLYRCEPGAAPRPLTPEPQSDDPSKVTCYADGLIDTARKLWIGVRQTPGGTPSAEINCIVAIDVERGGAGRVLVSGSDFYASPRLSPDGSRLAWLAWNHPDMPWTANELWVGDVTADGSANAVRVAAGAAESVFQPEWSPSGALYFVSDRNNWWNLYRWQDGRIDALCDTPADFGQAQWTFGMSTYCPLDDTRIVCSYLTRGMGKLAILDLRTGSLMPLAVPETEFASVSGAGGTIHYIGGSPTSPAAVVEVELASATRVVLRTSTVIDERLAAYLTTPRIVEFPTSDDRTAFALYYPPHNPDYVAPDGEKPPLLVKCHGGPTSVATSTLNLSTQFWTSRGIAVLDVNYGGSTGFGREYRDRLHLKWGIVDVDDCVNGAQHLVARGEVDGARVVMTGGSAGGYTTLAALAFKQCFRAGASLYGISDLSALARDTHKFELHYMDWLVAPFPAGEAVFKERSPLFHLEGFSAPVIFFQGSEDRVVPQSQTETIVEKLRERGVLVSYFLYNGEDHGFRNPDNIRNTLDAQLLFFDLGVFKSGLTFGARRRS